MRWGTLERVPQTPQNFSKTGLRLPGIGTFRAFLCLFLRGEAVVGGGVPVTEGERKKIGTAHRFRSRATIKKSGKVLGGSGDSFKSPPAHPCPRRALAPQAPPMPLPDQPRECKGRSPLHKKTKNSPFPPGRGLGGWGQQGKLKARSAGEAENSFKSPPAHPCPLRALAPQAPPMPLPAQPRGCKGRSPLHKKTKNPPFPGGEGGRGDGGRKASQGQVWQATRNARPPPGTCTAGASSAARDLMPGMQGAKPLA